MKSYFGYIRVSTPKQGRGVSLDEQRAAINAYAVETETAAKQGRTEYTKLLAALEDGKAAGVIIHKIDRSARNMKDWANLGELIDRGIDVQFAHESIDLRSRGGRLAADIQAVVAADYIRNLRDEVLKGFYGRLKQGVYPLPAPVGYLDQGAGVPKAIDPVTGPIVQFAFERYAKGDISLRSLNAELRSRGLTTRRGAMSLTATADMLHNPFYLGLIHIRRRGETFQGAHAPLVTKELFDRVQAVLSGKHVPKAKVHTFKYRGLFRHEGCSRRLTGELIKGRFTYYRCHGPDCHGVALTEGVIDDAIAAKVGSIVCSPEDMRDLRDIMEDERAERRLTAANDRQSLGLRIAQCNNRRDRLTDVFLDGQITKEVFDARNTRLQAERRGLEDQLNGLNGEAQWYQLYKEFELQNPKLLRYERLTGDEKRELLQEIGLNFSLEGKSPVIALRSPYREIEMAASVCSGGPHRGDVRTRAQQLFEILVALPSPGNMADEHMPSQSPSSPEVTHDRQRWSTGGLISPCSYSS
jgi:DNA invertase Pin-like site-specific DNA recombinase